MSSIVSTLDSQQISSLISSERNRLSQPIKNFQSQVQTDKTKISALGKVGGALSSLNSAVNAIADPKTFTNRSATSSDQSVATASVDRSAPTGDYSLTNVSLARSQEVYSKSYASGSASVGSGAGKLTFKSAAGQTETVTVSTADTTLNGVAQAINQVSGGQVKASLVGGSAGLRLVLRGTQKGADQSFSVAGSGALSAFNYTPGGSSNTLTVARAARNASAEVNGVPISSDSNTLDNALPGGSVALKGSGSTSLSVDVDAAKLSDAVSSVVSKLNSAVSTIHKETAYHPANANSGDSKKSPGKAGPLLGNYATNNIGNQLLSAVSGLATKGLSGRGIGITVNKDGSVDFDSGKFKSAYQSNPDSVETLVQQLHTRVGAVTDSATGVVSNGIIGSQKKALQNDIDALTSQITQQQKFVQEQIKNYSRQFALLQKTQSSLSTDSNYLSLLQSNASNNNG